MQRTFQKLVLVAAVGLAALLTGACGSGSGSSTNNPVAAVVNGRKIMMEEVERLVRQQSQGRPPLSSHDLAQARLTVLEGLIQREVLFQRAEQEKLLPTEEEITSIISNQRQQSGATQEEFDRQLKQQGLTTEILREEAKKDLAIKKLQDKYSGKINISDREVEEYYTSNKDRFVNQRGVALAMIAVDPADNSGMGITQGDAKSDAEAQTKINDVYNQLKNGADFAAVATAKSEDRSLLQGGDIGFATEDDLKGTGFSQDLIGQFFGPMQVGSYTAPVKFSTPQFPNGRWYIFKLKEKRLTTENLTLESPNVRQQITLALTDQRKQILNAALLEVAMTEAKVVNSLASDLLSNPGNLGLRPAGSPASAGASPAASQAATPAAKAAASPASTASPAK